MLSPWLEITILEGQAQSLTTLLTWEKPWILK
jgi:hypothetical protein